MISLLLLAAAHATPSFDPEQPAARFEGRETWTQDGATQLWSAIERLEDPSSTLFHAEQWNQVLAWPSEADWAPWIDDCFCGSQPASGSFLLHMGLHEQTASGTPVLLIPGAADNGSRAFVTLARHLDEAGRPVYALTFAHPHGDVLLEAEVVADAIARIRARTGAAQVDVVGHSKGGVVASIYASNHAEATWPDSAFEAESTRYRADIRRLVLLGTPLGGIDTAFRWSAASLSSLDADTALIPSAWSAWYPWTTAQPLCYTDLSVQDHLSADGDLFPGQRQLLQRQSAPLPYTLPELGAFSLQTDNWTTYEGGLGSVSWSEGIDEAIADGGQLLDRLTENGLDPAIGICILAGSNPLMPSGNEAWWATFFGAAWTDMATASLDSWASLLSGLYGDSLGVTEEELQGLVAGDLTLGECTGESDGVVFLDSALHASTLTGRGARVIASDTVNLSHLDLLYASPDTAEAMRSAARADPDEDGWMLPFAERYEDADTVGWVLEVLADDAAETGETGDDSASTDTAETDGIKEWTPKDASCGCSVANRSNLGAGALILTLLALLRRRTAWRRTFAKVAPWDRDR